jgi:hypothetical protein
VDDPEVPKQFTDYIDSIDFDDPSHLELLYLAMKHDQQHVFLSYIIFFSFLAQDLYLKYVIHQKKITTSADAEQDPTF